MPNPDCPCDGCEAAPVNCPGITPEITEAVLIAQQALRIANLEAEVIRMKDDRRSIHRVIYGCGGPLNDNVRGYTKDQMVPFAQIAQHIG